MENRIELEDIVQVRGCEAYVVDIEKEYEIATIIYEDGRLAYWKLPGLMPRADFIKTGRRAHGAREDYLSRRSI